MAITINTRNESKKLNPKTCLELWVKLGKLQAVREHLIADGVLNARGNPYETVTIRTYAMKYIVAYPQQAKEILHDSNILVAADNSTAWDAYVLQQAVSVYKYSSNKRKRQWAKFTLCTAKPGMTFGEAYPEFCAAWFGTQENWAEWERQQFLIQRATFLHTNEDIYPRESTERE